MSFLDGISSYVRGLFDSTPPHQQPVRPANLQVARPDSYQVAPARVPATPARGVERNFQNPAPSSQGSSVGGGLAAAGVVAGIALLAGATGGMALLLGGAAFLVGCGPMDEENPNNFNANVPEASAPITQDQWCDGIRSLSAAPITDASPLINRFPGISDDLRNLPAEMSAIGIAPQDISGNPQYAYVLVQNRRPISEREATEQSTYILLYERSAEGRYLPVQNRENDPLGSMRNVAHFDSLAADSITFVSASSFRQSTQADGATRANLFTPGLTDGDRIVIRFENGQVTLIPYGQNRPAGSADACGYYGLHRMPSASEAGVPMDAVVPDVRIQDAGRDSGMDAGRDGGTDASVDVRRDGSSDVRDSGTDRPDARNDAGVDARSDASADAARIDAGRDGGVDAARDANSDAARDSSSDAPRG